mmetsp:Transcript_22453/g.31215  ORF Transcript_22453/g.31215 Transcript_22453/m.31215 type:complete len:450 (-) Transcript_22453:242-1591(-)
MSSELEMVKDLSNVSLSDLRTELYARACPNFPPTDVDSSRVSVQVTDRESSVNVRQVDMLQFTHELDTLVEAFMRISAEINPDRAVETIIREAAALIKADRVTIYAVEEDGDLSMRGSTGKAPMRIEKGTGIPSWTAEEGKRIIVNDAKSHPLFDASRDVTFGYSTRNMLCAPATDNTGKAVAVLEVVNKLPEGTDFTELDATLLSSIAAIGGMTLRNSELFRTSLHNENRAHGLIDIISSLRMDNSANSLMFTINRRVQDLMEAEKSTFFVCDQKRHRLLSGSSDRATQLKIPFGQGITGVCAMDCNLIRLRNAQENPQFDSVVDQPVGLEARAVMCAPIVSRNAKGERESIGVIQLVNKKGSSGCFSEEDETLMERICDLIGKYGDSQDANHILHISHFESRCSDTVIGDGEATKFMSPSSGSGRIKNTGPSLKSMNVMEEGDEEDF